MVENKNRLVSATCLVIFVLTGAGCGSRIDRALDQVDQAMAIVASVGSNLPGMVETLRGLEDESAQWRSVVNNADVARTVGNSAAMIEQRMSAGVRSNLDFVRVRVIEDLVALKARIAGTPIPPRRPVLATSSSATVDINKDKSVEIAGWNLDIASSDRPNFPISILKANGESRSIEDSWITYQGGYMVTLAIVQGGEKLLRSDDVKIVFKGYSESFELPVVSQIKSVPDLEIHAALGAPLATWNLPDLRLAIAYQPFPGGTGTALIAGISYEGREILNEARGLAAGDLTFSLLAIGGPPYLLVQTAGDPSQGGFPNTKNFGLGLTPMQ